LTRKKASLNQAYPREVPKEAPKSVCTSTVISSDPFLPTTSTSSAVRTPEYVEENHDGPEPASEGEIQMEYSFN
jgi:hypothetical protein